MSNISSHELLSFEEECAQAGSGSVTSSHGNRRGLLSSQTKQLVQNKGHGNRTRATVQMFFVRQTMQLPQTGNVVRSQYQSPVVYTCPQTSFSPSSPPPPAARSPGCLLDSFQKGRVQVEAAIAGSAPGMFTGARIPGPPPCAEYKGLNKYNMCV